MVEVHSNATTGCLTVRRPVQVGFETEFVLLQGRAGDPACTLRPASFGQYGQTSTYDSMSPGACDLRDLAPILMVEIQTLTTLIA